jgi:hypothetical protein
VYPMLKEFGTSLPKEGIDLSMLPGSKLRTERSETKLPGLGSSTMTTGGNSLSGSGFFFFFSIQTRGKGGRGITREGHSHS